MTLLSQNMSETKKRALWAEDRLKSALSGMERDIWCALEEELKTLCRHRPPPPFDPESDPVVCRGVGLSAYYAQAVKLWRNWL